MGLLVLLASLLAALLGTGVASRVSARARDAVCTMLRIEDCGPAQDAASADPDAASDELSPQLSAAEQRAIISRTQKEWMADQASHYYVTGKATAEWTKYKRYEEECRYTEASCYAAAVLSLGGSLEDADWVWHEHCGPSDMSGCDSGAVIRDHLTEAILIDIPVGLATGGLVKFISNRAIFTAGQSLGRSAVDIQGARFAQKTFTETFDELGHFAGQSIDDVAGALRSGALAPKDAPIEVIVRDGNSLILNTRSAQALQRAGIPRSQWNVVDMTGDPLAEGRLSGQLARNGLDSAGTDTVRSSRRP